MNVERMAEEVERYLLAHAPLVGPGPPPSEPMGRRHKGSSRPPASPKAFAFWEANRIAADFIEWRVGDITRHNNAYAGIQFSELVTELYRNPAISQAWKAGETPEDQAEQEAFEKMCRLIAQDILATNPGASFFVTVNPKPLRDLDEEDDATPLQKHGAKHHRNRRYTYEHTARKRYERVKEIQAAENCTKSAAVGMMADEEDIGASTAWDCVKFCEKGDVA